jgi:hypothetical protein
MKKILCSALVLAVFVAVSVIGTSRSEALGGEALGCWVRDGQPLSLSSDCLASRPLSSYNILFAVQSESGSYTFSWNTNGAAIVSGCGSTDDLCTINVRGVRDFREYPVSVTLFQGGRQFTVSAKAEIDAVCGNDFC